MGRAEERGKPGRARLRIRSLPAHSGAEDTWRDYGERRVIALGTADGIPIVVVSRPGHGRNDRAGDIGQAGQRRSALLMKRQSKQEKPSRGRADLERLRRMPRFRGPRQLTAGVGRASPRLLGHGRAGRAGPEAGHIVARRRRRADVVQGVRTPLPVPHERGPAQLHALPVAGA